MNDYVSDLTDYNHRNQRVKNLPIICPDFGNSQEIFYDFGAQRDIGFSGFSLEGEEFSPFQKKLNDKCSKL